MGHNSGRIEYVDCIRGFLVLWVVLFHMGLSLSWLNIPYRMPLFFFISGFFFRPRPWGEFFMRRVQTLLVPYVFFYAVSAALCLVKYEVVSQLLPTVEYQHKSFTEYMFNPDVVNCALWFLWALFEIQMIFWALKKWVRRSWLIVAVCAGCYVLSLEPMRQGATMPPVMQFIVWYALGEIFARRMVEWLAGLDVRRSFSLSAGLAAGLYGVSLIPGGGGG